MTEEQITRDIETAQRTLYDLVFHERLHRQCKVEIQAMISALDGMKASADSGKEDER